jgi:N,N-dimethylformamidase
MLTLLGYADRPSGHPGETIRFMVSSETEAPYRAQIVRLICGDENPAGPGYRAEPIGSPIDGSYRGRRQTIRTGSCVRVPRLALPASFTLTALVWPTLSGGAPRGILAAGDVALALDEAGAAMVMVGNARLSTAAKLAERRWWLVAASYDAASGRATVAQMPVDRLASWARPAEVTASFESGRVAQDTSLLIGAMPGSDGAFGHYNGKIEAPAIFDRAHAADAIHAWHQGAAQEGLVAAWDFARGIPTTTVSDTGPHGWHGETVNLPARAVTGWRWDGTVHDWRQRPEHYGAIRFHEDDLYDASWQADFALTIPEDWPSGVYCAHLTSEDDEGFIPFAVRAAKPGTQSKLAFLMPTASYMAYANDHAAIIRPNPELLADRAIVLSRGDCFLAAHPEYGLSMYDTHLDGDGVRHSSRLRPIVGMRPKTTIWNGSGGSMLWQFNADTHLLEWLEANGVAYEVITDEDLHRDGLDLLRHYRCLITGTHPEYHSIEMLTAIRDFTESGGRLMYMGGNGFYWRIAYHQTLPGVIELRRAEDGTRPWAAEPGEYHHAFTGDLGGLWRRNGLPPQALTGVGFTGQGFYSCSWYRRLPGSNDPRAAFIFEGIGADERIGDFGLIGGGAAGLELDRAEPLLGTPPHALVLAGSENHDDSYLLANEEVLVMRPNMSGTTWPALRAELVFFETASGGAVFSTGSIAWCGSLAHANHDNNVARLTGNVLRRFLDPTPFAVP